MVLKYKTFIAALLLVTSSCNEDGFVSSVYRGKTPIATIKNLPIMSEEASSFSLSKDMWVQIYATGEASIDMVNVDPIYLYKPDAIDLYLKSNEESISLNFPLRDSLRKNSTVAFTTKGVGFTATYDSIQRLYLTKISVPLGIIGVTGKTNEKVLANIILADNDDGVKQKAKLAWAGNTDPLLSTKNVYGEILLKEESRSAVNDTAQLMLFSSFKAIVAVGKGDLPAVSIDKFIFGRINKAEDFSAKMSSEWNKDYLFLYLTIFDNKEGRIVPKMINSLSNFHDWGWIEDDHGNTIWTMTNSGTKHAGGAMKNRKTDTAIFLKKGNYKLKYTTDESHSWDGWDDEAPNVPFYGITLFEKLSSN